MIEAFLIISVIVGLACTVLLLIVLNKLKDTNSEDRLAEIKEIFDSSSDRTEMLIKDELARIRGEINLNGRHSREELTAMFQSFGDSLLRRMVDISTLQKNQLDSFRDTLSASVKQVDERIELFRTVLEQRLQSLQTDQKLALRQGREEVSASLVSVSDLLIRQLSETSQLLKNELTTFSEQLSRMIQSNELKHDQLRTKVEERLKELQTSNSVKLDEMRVVVDEKLNSTLEKRLGESFKLVSDRLEMVHKGLGEMQLLANGVGDLKRVLTNIKTRGTWGEVQLGSLIEQLLTPEQFARNVVTKKGSSGIVEYAIKMPGRSLNHDEVLWLPIDAKFPLEDYQFLCDAQDSANASLVEEAGKALENRIKLEARSICEKYLDPPNTTDFAILFLPIEGLFAEVLRRPGLSDKIQRDYRVIIAGPTTLSAILNSLQMGFRTLAIEKRSGEVWNLLSAVKTEFSNFGNILEKTKKKLQEASNTIDNASTASRRIERKLRDVQALPESEQINSGNKYVQLEPLRTDSEETVSEEL